MLSHYFKVARGMRVVLSSRIAIESRE